MELVINQDAANQNCCGVQKYVGSVRIDLQELDRQFPHMFQVEHVTLHQLDAGVHRGRVHDRRELLGVARDRLHAGHEAEDVPLPTAAPNIALVVGVYVDPNMHEVSHFCLPHLLPVLKNTVRQLYEVFEYYETILATQLPYTCYKQAFVDQLFEEVFHYSTLPIYKTIILHSSAVIDQTYETRKLPALGLAAQFFGCYVSTEKWPDRWIKKGKPLYLMGLWVKKTFGNNKYGDLVHQHMYEVIKYGES